jgi:hypothetical protein
LQCWCVAARGTLPLLLRRLPHPLRRLQHLLLQWRLPWLLRLLLQWLLLLLRV